MNEEIKIEIANWNIDHNRLIDIRTRVFVEEQQVPIELEVDEQDPHSVHIIACNSQQQPVGTARLLPTHYIGRMCVLKPYRQQGIGSKMLAFLINYARQHQVRKLQLNAQISALPFYRKHGFIEDSESFIEAGIEHKHMTLAI